MLKIKSFLKTTFFGGFLVVLPIVVLIFVLSWLFEFLTDKISPITNIIIQAARLNALIAGLLALILILLVFFLVGLIVQTKLGKFSFNFFEERFLKRVPLYRIIKETVIALFGGEKMIFKSVALVRPFGNDTMITAFVTDETEEYYTVFIPSAPAPTGGYIYHIKKENVKIINFPVEQAMKTILSLGAGSREFIKRGN